jgi:hypothetical protein
MLVAHGRKTPKGSQTWHLVDSWDFGKESQVTQVRSFSVLFPKVLQVQVKCDSTAPCVFAVSFSIGSRDLQAKRKKKQGKKWRKCPLETEQENMQMPRKFWFTVAAEAKRRTGNWGFPVIPAKKNVWIQPFEVTRQQLTAGTRPSKKISGKIPRTTNPIKSGINRTKATYPLVSGSLQLLQEDTGKLNQEMVCHQFLQERPFI